MICAKCGKYFPVRVKIDGKERNLKNRKFCLECSPFGLHNTKRLTRTEYKCSHCGETNPEKFTKGRYTECKKCRDRYNKHAMKSNKIQSVNYLGGKCMCCGFDKGISAFDFHHVDPSQKDSNFAHHSYWSWERTKNELDKCLLLCSNCHRMLHHNEVSYSDFKFLPEDKLNLIDSVGA